MQTVILLSPLVVILLGQVAIRSLSGLFGAWSWLPFCILYWLLIGGLVWLAGGQRRVSSWLRPSCGSRWWGLLGILLPTALTLPILLPNWQAMASAPVLLGTLLFVLLNPLLEELYWRGLLLDAAVLYPRWLGIGYSLFLFTLHHAWLGVISPAGRHPSAFVGPILLGTAWALLRLKTGSLRWPIVSHLLANLLGLSVPVFLGQYIPPGI